MITIKNDKGEICDYRPYICVDISEEIGNMRKLIEDCKQKMYEITGTPKSALKNEKDT